MVWIVEKGMGLWHAAEGLAAFERHHSPPVPVTSHQDNKGGKGGSWEHKIHRACRGDQLGLRTEWAGQGQEILLVHGSIPRRSWQHKALKMGKICWAAPIPRTETSLIPDFMAWKRRLGKYIKKKGNKGCCLKNHQGDPQQRRMKSWGEGLLTLACKSQKSNLPGSGIQAQWGSKEFSRVKGFYLNRRKQQKGEGCVQRVPPLPTHATIPWFYSPLLCTRKKHKTPQNQLRHQGWAEGNHLSYRGTWDSNRASELSSTHLYL